MADDSRWTIHAERLVDDTRRARVSIVEVELPDNVRFEQWVLRLPKAGIVVVLNDAGDNVLMLWRHRFVIDRWVWELPGGYLDDDEHAAASAAREVEEETGWRPAPLRELLRFQPMVGTVDSENVVFVAHGATCTDGRPDINESARVAWIRLAEVPALIRRGEIVGSASVVGLLATLTEDTVLSGRSQ
jgi:8-oxo-dGDP phosphatase